MFDGAAAAVFRHNERLGERREAVDILLVGLHHAMTVIDFVKPKLRLGDLRNSVSIEME